jgi:hypothetical protein
MQASKMLDDANDYLSTALPGWALDHREVAWLWMFMSACKEIELNDCSFNSQTMRDQIAHYVQFNQRLRNELNYARETTLLPSTAFDWVETFGRQPKWLAAQAMKKTSFMVLSSVFRTLSDKTKLIAVFDLWEAEFSRKEGVLRQLSSEWNQHLQADKIYTWFKGQDECEKYLVAWSWLEKNKSELTRKKKPFTRFAGLLDFFDSSGASPDEIQLYIDKIKRRWATKKTRENNPDKKQYNIELKKNVNAALDKLAQDHQLSRTKIIELLILNETEKRSYLAPK